jgi:hypothetical protein
MRLDRGHLHTVAPIAARLVRSLVGPRWGVGDVWLDRALVGVAPEFELAELVAVDSSGLSVGQSRRAVAYIAASP